LPSAADIGLAADQNAASRAENYGSLLLVLVIIALRAFKP
jgi:hypothetical protein